jgi:hypothetical protein
MFETYPELINRKNVLVMDSPDLLRMHSDSSKLDVKEENEKEFYYSNIKCSWILKRIMPDWIPNKNLHFYFFNYYIVLNSHIQE